jgi:hypothetical protein
MTWSGKSGFVFAVLLVLAVPLRAAEFYVATTGDDANAGTIDKPFATVQRAQQSANPGDTVFIRGGTYTMQESQIARRVRGFVYVTHLDKSGTPEKPIKYWPFEGERPVFDLSKVKPEARINAFQVSGSWLHIKGLEVVGVQVTLKGHTQSICFSNEGNNNVFEQLVMHDGQAIGVYSVRGSNNLYLNCDAFRNHDYTSEDGRGGNVDGFGCHPAKGSTGNVFRGCRAWFNSDDGYDCINSHEAVTFENCWAFYNGFGPKFERLADGNGFKAGGYASTPASRLPDPIPRHVVRFCMAVANKNSGFYANHHVGGGDWFNNTAYRNGINFNMTCRTPDNRTDVEGYGHKMRNNVGYKARTEVLRLDNAKSDVVNNAFTMGLTIGEKDFVNLDEAELVKPRQTNGDLPVMGFLHPSDGSQLIDRGIESGFAFRGKAPELGAFER